MGATSTQRKDRIGRRSVLMEGYGGIGYRVRRMRFTTHEGLLNNSPTIHFGLRLVLGRGREHDSPGIGQGFIYLRRERQEVNAIRLLWGLPARSERIV